MGIAVSTGATLDAGGPYKGLIAYDLNDYRFFFGRERATLALLEHMQRGRLTVLQSESGAGKSSLLCAGISPRLLMNGHLPVNVRPYDTSPVLKIKQAFLPNLDKAPELFELLNASLPDFLRRVTTVLGQSITLYLLLDQFEEFFTMLRDETARIAFIDELADCLEDQSLNVRWVLALRSEFFGDLSKFRPRIRNPFENDYRLNRLTRDAAQTVITEPAARYEIRFEQALVDQLLTALSGQANEIDPPQVQLVCLALYEAFKERLASQPTLPRVITQALYKAEGEAEGILRGHLDRVIRSRLQTKDERSLARQLLVALVSSEQRRIRRTRSDLAKTLTAANQTTQNLDAILPQVDAVLGQLVDNRLLNVEKDELTDDACVMS